MDLPTCPHCGQSVLDDEAEDCPFCGESMSAKPTGKRPSPQQSPPAQKPSPPKAEAKAPAKRPEKAKSRPAATGPSEDQPFAVDQAAMSNAVPLRPKPTPGRAYKVICPMCETAGYTSPKAGGREVKCANPKCLVPIFTCPEPPPAPVEEVPPEPPGLSTTQLGLISVVALAAIGAGIWFFVLKGDSSTKPPEPDAELAANAKNTEEVTTPEASNVEINQPLPPVRQGPDLGRLLEQAPAKMIATSQLPTGRGISRPKPLRVAWTALGLAELGDLKQAEEQLERLPSFNDDEPHYRVLPWVEIAWQLRQRKESPTPAIDKALEFAKDHPASLRESWQEAVSLSALLAASNRGAEALPVLQRKLGTREDQELWADMQAVNLDGSFNLEAWEQFRPVVTPINPSWSGVVWQLVFHDSAAEGLDWAKGASDPQSRGEALIAWADAVTDRGIATLQPAETAPLDAAIGELPATWPAVAKARAYARMGQRLAMAGDSAKAETFLGTAKQALSTFPEEEPMPVPDLKAIHAGSFSRGQVGQHIAAAAFEVARLQSTLKHPEDAWKSIEQGLAALRSETLPLHAARQLQADTKTISDMRTALSLGSDDEARQAKRAYEKHLNELSAQAQERLQLQASLLSQAARWNLANQVYEEITKMPESQGGDSYFDTDLPWVVLAELRGQKSESADALEALLKEKKLPKPKGQALLENSARWMSNLDIPKVVDGLGRETLSLPSPVRKRWLFRLGTREVQAGHTNDVLSFLLALFSVDPFAGEDAAELLAGLATRNGQGELVWNELDQRSSWSPTQKIAAYRGFIAAANFLAERDTK